VASCPSSCTAKKMATFPMWKKHEQSRKSKSYAPLPVPLGGGHGASGPPWGVNHGMQLKKASRSSLLRSPQGDTGTPKVKIIGKYFSIEKDQGEISRIGGNSPKSEPDLPNRPRRDEDEAAAVPVGEVHQGGQNGGPARRRTPRAAAAQYERTSREGTDAPRSARGTRATRGQCCSS
jgi:hypothetical protein